MPLRISDGQTKIYNKNGGDASTTKTHLSTNINILVHGVAVGAVQSISINEGRAIKQVVEIGTDGNIDSAPTSATTITGSCKRVRFDGQRIAEAFMRGFVHVASQRIPFDITIVDKFSADNADDGGSFITTTIKNVWIKQITTDYQADNFIIMDSMDWEAETIFSIRNQGPVIGSPNNAGTTMDGAFELNVFEQQADTGLYRGSLDAPGLLKAFDGSGGRQK
jgi:hypothetical protein